MKSDMERELPAYDFCLNDELNEKLKKAIHLLDEVDIQLRATNEDYLEPFLYELRQGTRRITDAVRGLDQDPVV